MFSIGKEEVVNNALGPVITLLTDKDKGINVLKI